MKSYLILLLIIFTACTATQDNTPQSTEAFTITSRPNFLIIMADDCTMRDLEVYNGQAKTPNLIRLSQESMLFKNCFQATAMCSPTRQNLLTGLYPVRNGAYRNHSKVKEGTKSVVQHLGKQGYDMWFTGKQHIGPKEVFDFRYSDNTTDPDIAFISSAIDESTSRDKPFCLYAMCSSPHVPYTYGDTSQYPVQDVRLPEDWIDTPETRSVFSQYLAEISYFDQQVGQIVELLDSKGLKENTVVIILGEHGSLFPFEKWTCYDEGLRSLMLVRYPQIAKPKRVDAMVEYVDILPTMLDLAGAKVDSLGLDGKSFQPILGGTANVHKEYVFGIQTTIGVNLAKAPYGIRSVRSTEYKYIRNLFPENQFSNAVLADPSIWSEARQEYLGWMTSWKKAAKIDAKAHNVLERYTKRPYEELYDIENDPEELHNLANDPKLKTVREELANVLEQWMLDQGDKGRETEVGNK